MIKKIEICFQMFVILEQSCNSSSTWSSSVILSISSELWGHVNELQHVRFSLDDSQRSNYELSAII